MQFQGEVYPVNLLRTKGSYLGDWIAGFGYPQHPRISQMSGAFFRSRPSFVVKRRRVRRKGIGGLRPDVNVANSRSAACRWKLVNSLLNQQSLPQRLSAKSLAGDDLLHGREKFRF